MTSPREATQPFPESKDRSGWVVIERVAPHLVGTMVEFEYEGREVDGLDS